MSDSEEKVPLGTEPEHHAPQTAISFLYFHPEPEKPQKPWERVLWLIGLIGGISAFFSTWLNTWTFLNARRDLIFGIGQSKSLSPENAELIFKHDWIPTVLSFCVYVLIVFLALWYFLVKCPPMQNAILDSFESSESPKIDAINSEIRLTTKRALLMVSFQFTSGLIDVFSPGRKKKHKTRIAKKHWMRREAWRIVMAQGATVLIFGGFVATIVTCWFDYASTCDQMALNSLQAAKPAQQAMSLAVPTNDVFHIMPTTNALPSSVPLHP
ncbi:MAG TPA: hypothetical protein VG347_02955 [Verrucomicrobiae bacterium]|nr:hypothetical protein [Verrucomicrobiae bacterium]